MKTFITSFIIACAWLNAGAQDSLTLFRCHEMAVKNNPLSGELSMIQASRNLKLDNLSANWYPNLELNGQYTYQSDVITLDVALPFPDVSFPVMPHDNYKMTLDVRQMLYDGGITKAGKIMEDRKYEADMQEVRVALHDLKNRVNAVYFRILLLQKQEHLLGVKYDDLRVRKEVVASGVKNGILLQEDLDMLRAEMLRLEQQLQDIRISKISGISALSHLTGIAVDTGTVFVRPEFTAGSDTSGTIRPEYLLFDRREASLEAGRTMNKSARKPKLFVFGQFGYGKPGLNYFSDEFNSFYILGAGLKWKIWDWGVSSRERQMIDVGKDIIDTQRQAFTLNMEVDLDEDRGRMEKYSEMARLDREIVDLREGVRKTAASRLENGVITTSDYLAVLNAETQARITLATHELQLSQARVGLLMNKGVL